MAKLTIAHATAELARVDPIMRSLVERKPAARFRRRGRDHFSSLVHAIVYQQLAGRAAETIHGRLVDALGGEVSVEAVLRRRSATLRKAGLSAAKEASIRDLAKKVGAGVVRLDSIARLGDEAVVKELVQVRGIGRWTAEMFLIFQLGRLDVWPVSDFGVRKGYMLAYGGDAMPSTRELEEAGERFRPFRSLAAWYCWRATEQD